MDLINRFEMDLTSRSKAAPSNGLSALDLDSNSISFSFPLYLQLNTGLAGVKDDKTQQAAVQYGRTGHARSVIAFVFELASR